MLSIRVVRLLMDRISRFNPKTTGAQDPVVFLFIPASRASSLNVIEPIEIRAVIKRHLTD
jgi:hypothetical protein